MVSECLSSVPGSDAKVLQLGRGEGVGELEEIERWKVHRL